MTVLFISFNIQIYVHIDMYMYSVKMRNIKFPSFDIYSVYIQGILVEN